MKENQLEKPNSNLPSRYRKTMEISKNICKVDNDPTLVHHTPNWIKVMLVNSLDGSFLEFSLTQDFNVWLESCKRICY